MASEGSVAEARRYSASALQTSWPKVTLLPLCCFRLAAAQRIMLLHPPSPLEICVRTACVECAKIYVLTVSIVRTCMSYEQNIFYCRIVCSVVKIRFRDVTHKLH